MKTTLVVLVAVLVACQARRIVSSRFDTPSVYENIGRANPNQVVDVVFALRQRNLDVLEEMFWSVSEPSSNSYGKFLTKEQIVEIIAPAQKDHDAVVHWISSFNVGAGAIQSLGDAINVRLTVSQVEQMLETTMFNFIDKKGRMVTRHMGTSSLPRGACDIVEFVSGVSEFPMPRPDSQKSSLKDAYVVPQTISELYNIGDAVANSQSSQGVIEFQDDNSYSTSDLTSFYKGVGVTTTPVSHTVGPFKGRFPDTEASLDIDYVTAVGINAVNWYWTAENWMYDFAVNFFSTKDIPMVVSMSWGYSENAQCSIDTECSTLGIDSPTYVQRVNTEFMKIGLRGTTLISASGDSGANGRTDPFCTEPTLLPDYPAASPYVISVGATQLNSPVASLQNPPPVCSDYACASAGDEVAVSVDMSGFASGGGFSNVSPRPSYQDDAVSAYLQTSAIPPTSVFNTTGRGYPDIAALGHNFLCYISGRWSPVGGTSASAPTVAGIFAILNAYRLQSGQSAIGFANPFLYTMAKDHPAAFNDIVEGDNICTEYGCQSSCQGFKATQGWDAVTGLGSPNVAEIISYIQSQA